MKNLLAVCVFATSIFATCVSSGQDDHIVYEPAEGASNGKHIVLISGDEEYRSEESCTMLGKILSQKHGFKCTVLFAIDPETGCINPNNVNNIGHLESLGVADLMIIGTRLRTLPDEQLQHFLDFLNAGKPIIGFRTSTHAFTNGNYGDFDWGNFGVNIIGENWISHHGDHKRQGGRGLVVEPNADHPILNSVRDVFTTSDIYGIRNLDEEDATILMRGAVTETLDPASKIIGGGKNDPMMPLAWLRNYTAPSGSTGRCLGTTAGASVDFRSADLRRMIVNGSHFLLDMEVPEMADVDYVDPFEPSFYSFMPENYFIERNLRPADFALGSQPASVPIDMEPVEK
ncbi:MAG: ThuA domain-containing protein [Planctomycetota bacterium]